jgi:replicative superfamily II helicase
MSSSKFAPGGQFYGLFIGINQYQSYQIGNLASAVRDAEALHALFTDNLGGTTTLLTDDQATTARLRQSLAGLQDAATEDDVVVISFSGHGSDTHELVTFDTDLDDLPGTTLPLSELTDLVSGIPAKHLLIVLDCCFSGGAGAKVLHAPRRPRGGTGGPLSTAALLDQIAGTGRVIVTASTAEQEAWEDPRLGHGYLTHFLIQGFLGPGEIAKRGRVNLLDLLKYITENVRSSVSGSEAARQDPTLRGQWDGAVEWPIFTPGPLYTALYPPLTVDPVTNDVASLAGHGLPANLIEVWAKAIPRLNQLQQDAVNEAGLLKGDNVVVVAPTSSGKTMVGELAALRATQTGGRSVFLLPTKALVNEQHDRFTSLYGPCGVRTIRATGDYNDDVAALLRGQFDLGIFTYEKFSGLILANPYLLRLISVVVVDEVQTIVDQSRGRELELLLTLIKTRQDEGIEPQIVALSAVLGELNGLDSWLGAYLLITDERPVPLEEGVLDTLGQYTFRDADGNETIEQLLPAGYYEPRARGVLIPLVAKLVGEGQQVIIIRGERGNVRGAARYLSSSLGLPPAQDALSDLPAGDLTASANELRSCLAGGVAFHTSDLGRDERRVVEDHFRKPDSAVRVVVATTTLAQGINMPAETVVMPELNRRIGNKQLQWYSVADYKNIAGRAGRLGLVDKGRAIVLAYDQATLSTVWTGYINGQPEDVESTLLGQDVDLYTVVLRVAAIASNRSDDGSAEVGDLIAILANSLAAHQARLRRSSQAFDPIELGAIIDELRDTAFLESVGTTRIKPSDLGLIVAGSALRVQSAVRVANVLRQLEARHVHRDTILAIAQTTAELDAYRLIVNAKGVQKELQTFVGELSARVPGQVVRNYKVGATDRLAVAARAKKAVACMLWVNAVPMAQIEQTIMRHYFDRNASGPISGVIARTRDVVETIMAIAAELHPAAPLAELIDLLPIQLEFGVTMPHAALIRAGANLRREDYIGLNENGLRSYQDVDAADAGQLLRLLGGNATAAASLRSAVDALKSPGAAPSLSDLLGPPMQQ